MRIGRIIKLGLMGLASPLLLSAQNITDLAVMNDRSSDAFVLEDGQSAVDDSVFLHPDRIRFDNRCIQIEGEDVFLFSGAFHYFRVPQPLWPDRFSKLKKAGFNCVETYIPWNWHEQRMPKSVSDESCLDMTLLEDFLKMAEEFGLYVIVRPGPYICAEWSGGGFPQWLMRKKPAKPKYETWLQSTDEEFMRWNEHWYKAVCRVVAPHQLPRKEKGSGGVILFQIENEFNRIKWFSKESKKEYLEGLWQIVRNHGIEVPIVTCWTDEARNAGSGTLNGVLDMVNSYPKWNVEGSFGRLINQQLKTQPGKPLLSGELQGGWMSEVGGKLSWEQDGLLPVQTQNITLYALQRGFCGINYYMAVGGTNFDDWGARQMTTTYDYAAAIGEDGSLNDRYRRLTGLAEFVKEHGTRIVRASLEPTDYTTTDEAVKLAVRKAANGDRYYFVRTEEHTRHHFGTLKTADVTLDFSLEPFGAMVCYLPAGVQSGKWYPELPEPGFRPCVEADSIWLEASQGTPDRLPAKWKKLKKGYYLDDEGIYGRHFVYYRCHAAEGGLLEVGRIGDKLINGTDKDEVLVKAAGQLLPVWQENDTCAAYRLPGDSLSGKRMEVLMLFESKGLHHHTKKVVEDYWCIGPDFVRCNGKDLTLYYAYTEKERGEAYSSGTASADRDEAGTGTADDALLVWHEYSFTMPADVPEVNVPYHLYMEHSGNGFIYLNGHCLGRCWEAGPQNSYYLPECWLNRGGTNRIVVSMRPVDGEADIRKAVVVPAIWATMRETNKD
ncbi:beta-galactosidase [uncultured Bacteroides sp.]|uniref:beta-galactosidase n=1 Tax=uncultured Bacteroides sp. TaxID=162156 RepID=UPI002629C099|nr:beta-galactosidase [uncultured Bacteroides sp.]